MAEPLPKISIVTPSYNQGRFLEEAMLSVLTQDYPDLEYVVVDGGSTDGSVDLIRRHEERLAYWVSKPDAGQYDALDKGFSKTTGEVMACPFNRCDQPLAGCSTWPPNLLRMAESILSPKVCS